MLLITQSSPQRAVRFELRNKTVRFSTHSTHLSPQRVGWSPESFAQSQRRLLVGIRAWRVHGAAFNERRHEQHDCNSHQHASPPVRLSSAISIRFELILLHASSTHSDPLLDGHERTLVEQQILESRKRACACECTSRNYNRINGNPQTKSYPRRRRPGTVERHRSSPGSRCTAIPAAA